MKTIKKILLKILLVLLPVVLFFALLEGAARVREYWYPPLQVDIGQGFDAESLLFHPAGDGDMKTNPDKVTAFHEQRFSMPKPPRTMRIFALGGSSVNYLDYEFSLMAKELQQAWADRFDEVEIINCGGLSYGSHRLVLMMAEILHYEPDLVLLYSGHNEFEELQQLQLSNLEFVTAQRTLGYSALYRFIRDMRAKKQIEALHEASARRQLAASLPDTSKAWAYEFTDAEVSVRMDAYRDNLVAIIKKCRYNDIPVIIGTVPSNLWRPNLPGQAGREYEAAVRLFEAGKYEEGLALGRTLLREATPRHQASDVESQIIRDVAAQLETPLADVEQAILGAEPHHVPGETLFRDHCHLNAAGNALLRQVYQEKILEVVSF